MSETLQNVCIIKKSWLSSQPDKENDKKIEKDNKPLHCPLRRFEAKT